MALRLCKALNMLTTHLVNMSTPPVSLLAMLYSLCDPSHVWLRLSTSLYSSCFCNHAASTVLYIIDLDVVCIHCAFYRLWKKCMDSVDSSLKPFCHKGIMD